MKGGRQILKLQRSLHFNLTKNRKAVARTTQNYQGMLTTHQLNKLVSFYQLCIT